MLVLQIGCGGKADHGILKVDARIYDNKLTLIARDQYYNDYGSGVIPESEHVYFHEINVTGLKVDRLFLYENIKVFLAAKRLTSYQFEIDDIEPLEGLEDI